MNSFSNGGQEYQPVGEPVATNVYDLKGELGKVTPYGVYDPAANTGWVSVGSDHDTGQFALESIRRWWDKLGRLAYPEATTLEATTLLITADGGGSNGYRLRLWKRELAELATQTRGGSVWRVPASVPLDFGSRVSLSRAATPCPY